jgi:DNA invertase Pin-like site-specific DNA recombinase
MGLDMYLKATIDLRDAIRKKAHEKDIAIEKTPPIKRHKVYEKKSKHTPEIIAEMKRLLDLGLSKSKISRQLNIPRATIYYYLKEMEMRKKLQARMQEEA